MDNALADLFSKLSIKPTESGPERKQFLLGIRNHLKYYPDCDEKFVLLGNLIRDGLSRNILLEEEKRAVEEFLIVLDQFLLLLSKLQNKT